MFYIKFVCITFIGTHLYSLFYLEKEEKCETYKINSLLNGWREKKLSDGNDNNIIVNRYRK